MIRSFESKDTARVHACERVPRYSIAVQKIAARKLAMIDAAITVHDLRVPPGNRLEKLQGDRKGQYSVRINDQWRICFRFVEGNAYDVAIVDYH